MKISLKNWSLLLCPQLWSFPLFERGVQYHEFLLQLLTYCSKLWVWGRGSLPPKRYPTPHRGNLLGSSPKAWTAYRGSWAEKLRRPQEQVARQLSVGLNPALTGSHGAHANTFTTCLQFSGQPSMPLNSTPGSSCWCQDEKQFFSLFVGFVFNSLRKLFICRLRLSGDISKRTWSLFT